jgi:adenylylsulfate kinase-like enzyme
MVILLFGQPASGKTTLADLLVPSFGSNLIRLDGDVWREITENKDFSKEGRMKNLKGAYDMAIYLSRNGMISLMSFVSPYEDMRQYLRSKTTVCEIYLYYSGDRGRNNYFAKDFEIPQSDCLKIDTSVVEVEDCLKMIREYVKNKTNI